MLANINFLSAVLNLNRPFVFCKPYYYVIAVNPHLKLRVDLKNYLINSSRTLVY